MIVRSIFCLLLFVFSAFAQNSDDAAKIKQQRQSALTEQILSDIPNLKLGENRAVAYVRVGNLVWQTDKKRARSLFQNAVGELINAQILAEADKKHIYYENDMLTGQNARPQILNIIANRDAELALEYLYKTRPAKILKAFSILSKQISKTGNSENFSYLVQDETNLEQNFIRLAADQNPERAVKLLKELLKKGMSNDTLNLLRKLHEKDAESADEFASEIVGKLLAVNFDVKNESNNQHINVATAFLADFIGVKRNPPEKFLKLDDSQMKSLADKLISFYLQQGDRYGYPSEGIFPIAKTFAPESVEKLKQKLGFNPQRNSDSDYYPKIGELLNGEATAEQLLDEAKKFPKDLRQSIYLSAVNKFARQEEWSRAKEVLTDAFSDDFLETAIHNLDLQHSNRLIGQGKFAEAERMIDEFPENMRLGALVNFANTIYQQDAANKSYSMAILGKARALIAENPEDSTEMEELMQIISAYLVIESVEAFRLFKSLIPQINELSEAIAVINGFERGSNVKNGEFILTSGNPVGSYLTDSSILAKLAESDFDRLTILIDGFSRHESRIALKLQLAEGILNRGF